MSEWHDWQGWLCRRYSDLSISVGSVASSSMMSGRDRRLPGLGAGSSQIMSSCTNRPRLTIDVLVGLESPHSTSGWVSRPARKLASGGVTATNVSGSPVNGKPYSVARRWLDVDLLRRDEVGEAPRAAPQRFVDRQLRRVVEVALDVGLVRLVGRQRGEVSVGLDRAEHLPDVEPLADDPVQVALDLGQFEQTIHLLRDPLVGGQPSVGGGLQQRLVGDRVPEEKRQAGSRSRMASAWSRRRCRRRRAARARCGR